MLGGVQIHDLPHDYLNEEVGSNMLEKAKIHGVPLLSKKNFVIVGDFAKPLPLMIMQNAAGIQVGGKFKYEKLWTFLLSL